MTWFSTVRVAAIYLWRHGRLPHLDRPRRFTEWVQWRKLVDRDQRLARLTDKIWSKALAESAIQGISVPTLWSGVTLPENPIASLPLVVKSNHGCNQYRVVRTEEDWRSVRRTAHRWLRRSYGGWLDEWHYRLARRFLIVEPFLGGEGAPLPLDYKVYVFGGRAEVVQVHVGRGEAHRWTQFDREWRPLSDDPINVARPADLPAMIATAERLASGFDFLRVDLYEVAGRLWFGEFCLFPGSGLDPFTPAALDDWLGDCWSGVRVPATDLAPFPFPAAA